MTRGTAAALILVSIWSTLSAGLASATARPDFATWQAQLWPDAKRFGIRRNTFDQAFERLTLGAAPQSCMLTIKGRKLPVTREAAGVARFTFDELCARPLWAEDYRAIAATFHTVLLDNIPILSPAKRNEAARFVTLIDTLYEAKVKLVASAEAEPEALDPEGDGSFEFQRTASRLHEMRSIEYMAEAHIIPMDQK